MQPSGLETFSKSGGFYFLGLPAEAGISIVNLQILEIREEIDGVLQLTFAKEADRQQAKEILAAYELKK